MTLPPDVVAFVRAAVILPEERLVRIDREWDRLQAHRSVVAEVVRSGPEELQSQARQLREFVLAEARRAATERPEERLIPEDMTEAILPAARALLMRRALQSSEDPRKSRAFTALTAPFADILPTS
ncbi:MAG TPA: hypothetical protein VFH40_04005 [Gemmatimonadales bacterium]|jgi:hypothetical protein|nr:hypothetical protein [Gemmatimonadales bacterium]